MDDELDTFALGDTNLERATVLIGSDQHHEIIEVEHTYWVPIGVQHVLVFDPVLPSAVRNHRIHSINLT